MEKLEEKKIVFNEFSKITLTIVFTILALGEIAYYIGRYLNC